MPPWHAATPLADIIKASQGRASPQTGSGETGSCLLPYVFALPNHRSLRAFFYYFDLINLSMPSFLRAKRKLAATRGRRSLEVLSALEITGKRFLITSPPQNARHRVVDVRQNCWTAANSNSLSWKRYLLPQCRITMHSCGKLQIESRVCNETEPKSNLLITFPQSISALVLPKFYIHIMQFIPCAKKPHRLY